MAVRGGRYELIRAIASGGMATVHLGRALGAGGFERLVAIKVMHAHLAEEPEFVDMFLDEARLAARIRHPNVVGTIDIQQDEQGLFLVMDYVEGPSLQRVLRASRQRQRTLPLDVALRVFLDALAGLHAAHELRGPGGEPLHLVHRDVSPQNILIGVDGVAQITDFGVARAESRVQTTKAGVVKGKVSYMAPEQIRSEPIDRRTDVHAAGVLLWELLTGQRLIRGESDAAMMEKILRGQHPSPHEVSSAVPEAISAVCMRALAAAPDHRFPTANAFAEAIEAAAASEGIAVATPRVLAAFIKDLGLEPAEGPAPLSASKPLEASPSSRPEAGMVSAATAAPSTHTASHPPGEAKPRRSGALRWIGGALVILAAGGWLLVTRGPLEVTPWPLKVSWRIGRDGGHRPSSSALPAAATPPPAAPAVQVLEAPPAAAAATASASASAAPPSPSATLRPGAHPGASPSPPAAGKPDANPASFRPKDL
jgi:serine/threonine-protein kinase